MSGGMIAFLALEAIIFAIWAYHAFAILFHLRRWGVEHTGSVNPGPITFINAVSFWMKNPEETARRRRFLALTVLLFIIIALSAAYLPTL